MTPANPYLRPLLHRQGLGTTAKRLANSSGKGLRVAKASRLGKTVAGAACSAHPTLKEAGLAPTLDMFFTEGLNFRLGIEKRLFDLLQAIALTKELHEKAVLVQHDWYGQRRIL